MSSAGRSSSRSAGGGERLGAQHGEGRPASSRRARVRHGDAVGEGALHDPVAALVGHELDGRMHVGQVALGDAGEHRSRLRLEVGAEVALAEAELLLEPPQRRVLLVGEASVGGGVAESAAVDGERRHAHLVRRERAFLRTLSSSAISSGVSTPSSRACCSRRWYSARARRRRAACQETQPDEPMALATRRGMIHSGSMRRCYVGVRCCGKIDGSRPSRTFRLTTQRRRAMRRYFWPSRLTTLGMLSVSAPAAAQQHAGHGAGAASGVPRRLARPRGPRQPEHRGRQFMRMGESYPRGDGPARHPVEPANTAAGEYRLSVTFAQARAPERLEGFGLLGRPRPGSASQDYLYFLIRHDGRYMVRHRAGDEVHTLAEWTEHDAIRRRRRDDGRGQHGGHRGARERVEFPVNGTDGALAGARADAEHRRHRRLPCRPSPRRADARVRHHASHAVGRRCRRPRHRWRATGLPAAASTRCSRRRGRGPRPHGANLDRMAATRGARPRAAAAHEDAQVAGSWRRSRCGAAQRPDGGAAARGAGHGSVCDDILLAHPPVGAPKLRRLLALPPHCA
jgi:hypothetical protein